MVFADLGPLLAQLLQDRQLLQPVHPALGEDPQINALVSDAATMQQDMGDAAARRTSLESYLTTLQSESESLLRQDAPPAMDALVLVNRIESLHQITQDQRTSALMTYRGLTSAFGAIQARMLLVNECKSQSRVVFCHFRSLSEKARDLTQKFTESALENSGTWCKLQRRAENQRANWHGQKATAEAHILQARETIRSAERKRDSRESARVVRNFLTFGIGEVFDFFDLDEEIEDGERTVASAEQSAQACKHSIRRAEAALQRINEQVAHLNMLGGTDRAQETMLQASVTHGQALRTRTNDLTNASLDVSLFVGTLAARSETFAVHHTVQEFAQSILGFGRLMVSEGRLNGLLVQRDPGALQETLNTIAQSDTKNSIAGNDQFIETQQQQAIEDMM